MDEWMTAARAAGWLPPDEVKFKAWRAANLNRDACRWCGAPRIASLGREPRLHTPSCRFYDGPVQHGFHSGHQGSFDYWIHCTCGTSYPMYGIDGNEQECPDREMAWRHPKEPDLMATAPLSGSRDAPEVPSGTANRTLSLVNTLRDQLIGN